MYTPNSSEKSILFFCLVYC